MAAHGNLFLQGSYMYEPLKRSITGLFLIIFLSGLYFFPTSLSAFFLIVMGYLFAFEWPRISNWCVHILCKLALLVYFIIPFILLTSLNHSPNRILLVVLFIMVFSFDSASYCAGKIFGKNLIAPSISPKKTWEGVFGGVIGCTISLSIITYILNAPHNLSFIPFSIIVCILAFLGDMFESFLKRRAHIKDSGTLLPGHGGILDRFDSVLLVSYLFFLIQDQLVIFLGL